MIKQIQLRGISRTPSDRMTADGGCAESLNVYLDQNETAPALMPEDVTALYGDKAASGIPGKILYIHKGIGYNNLIYLDDPSGVVMAYPHGGNMNASALTVYKLQGEEDIVSVTSIGNTLEILTSERIEYVLYKNGEYKDLGDRVPVPYIRFESKKVTDEKLMSVKMEMKKGLQILTRPDYGIDYGEGDGEEYTDGYSNISHDTSEDYTYFDGIEWMYPAYWQSYLIGNIKTVSAYKASFAEMNTKLWDEIKMLVSNAKKNGSFATPVFARYALRLFDGNYIYQSVPVLLGAGLSSGFVTVKGVMEFDKAGQTGDGVVYDLWNTYFAIDLNNLFKAVAKLESFQYSGWEDVIESVDIFLSTGVHNPTLNTDVNKFEYKEGETYGDFTGRQRVYDIALANGEENDAAIESRIKDELLSKTVFYKIASFAIGDLQQLYEGYDLLSRKEFASEDYLVTQTTLPDDFLSHHRKTPGAISRYNNRSILMDVKYELSSGYPFTNGSILNGTNDISYIYDLKYYIRTPGNAVRTVTANGISGYYDLLEGEVKHSEAYAWLAYPDSRCFRVDVRITKTYPDSTVEVTYRTYDMVSHPGLNCSYAYIGFGNVFGVDGGGEIPAFDPYEADDNVYEENNIIWASPIGNPFAYLASGKMTFDAEVVGVANATKALSEGQFGQYPLYVFTKDGIWSLPVNDLGDFAASVPMSRDVAISADAIQNLEQAIVFVSAQGVMLLQGSDIVSISKQMNGEHFVAPGDVISMLGKDDDALSMIEAYTDSTPFQQYVSGCKIAYDYTNRRLIFFREDKAYEYVYMMETQTWHKFSICNEGLNVVSSINSYPDCYLCVNDGVMHHLLDFSTEYNASTSQKTLPCLIITRPFDLEAPDIRKAIKSIRIRGNYNKGDVRYILIGSMDGFKWGALHSLRGGSYRMFRVAILANLSAMERISWIDVDFEPRFNTRLR